MMLHFIQWKFMIIHLMMNYLKTIYSTISKFSLVRVPAIPHQYTNYHAENVTRFYQHVSHLHILQAQWCICIMRTLPRLSSGVHVWAICPADVVLWHLIGLALQIMVNLPLICHHCHGWLHMAGNVPLCQYKLKYGDRPFGVESALCALCT